MTKNKRLITSTPVERQQERQQQQQPQQQRLRKVPQVSYVADQVSRSSNFLIIDQRQHKPDFFSA